MASGFFGKPLDELLDRTRPPPLLHELETLFDAVKLSRQNIAAILDLASHPSATQPLDAACATLDSCGAHFSLTEVLSPVLLAGWRRNGMYTDEEAEAALGFGLLLRWLRALPSAAVPSEMYSELLAASASTVPSLLRQKLPTTNALLLEALGGFLGRLLVKSSISHIEIVARGDAADERAIQALIFALTPAILRSADGAVGVPPIDRVAAQRTVRVILRHYVQREHYRILSEAPPSQVDTCGIGATTSSAPATGCMPATLSPLESNLSSPLALPSSTSSLLPPTSVPAPVLVTAASAIMRMFEREFGCRNHLRGETPRAT